jgi:hypothetical protein
MFFDFFLSGVGIVDYEVKYLFCGHVNRVVNYNLIIVHFIANSP